ncbi:hypothetical protein GCM10008012_59780 [Rhizobium anhuiense]|nr:hypothetical protein GCM10008012_59780 [Rhizobium anhuiense]
MLGYLHEGKGPLRIAEEDAVNPYGAKADIKIGGTDHDGARLGKGAIDEGGEKPARIESKREANQDQKEIVDK